MPFDLTYYDRDQQPHYSDREMPARNPDYTGAAVIWDEDAARAVQSELLSYFGVRNGEKLPPPPVGLPGRRFGACHEVMEILSMGLGYYAAMVEGMPGRQWSIHEELSKRLRQIYQTGIRDEFDRETELHVAEATRRFEAGEFNNPEADNSKVYFIASETGPIKIGMALDPVKRLKGLQTSHHDRLAILAICDGGRDQETAYHKQFAPFRLEGEWFARSQPLLAEIDRLNQQVLGYE